MKTKEDRALMKYATYRLEHAKKRAEELRESQGEKPEEGCTYSGGYSLGLWEGRVTAYQTILDDLESREDETEDESTVVFRWECEICGYKAVTKEEPDRCPRCNFEIAGYEMDDDAVFFKIEGVAEIEALGDGELIADLDVTFKEYDNLSALGKDIVGAIRKQDGEHFQNSALLRVEVAGEKVDAFQLCYTTNSLCDLEYWLHVPSLNEIVALYLSENKII